MLPLSRAAACAALIAAVVLLCYIARSPTSDSGVDVHDETFRRRARSLASRPRRRRVSASPLPSTAPSVLDPDTMELVDGRNKTAVEPSETHVSFSPIAQPTSSHAPSLARAEPLVNLTAHVRITRAKWEAVVAAADCWASQGSWEELRGGFVWVPKASCPPFKQPRPATKTSPGCRLLDATHALLRSNSRAVPSLKAPALFIGDSLSMQFHAALTSYAPGMFMSKPVPPQTRKPRSAAATEATSALGSGAFADAAGSPSRKDLSQFELDLWGGELAPPLVLLDGMESGRRLRSEQHELASLRGCSRYTAELFRNDLLLRDGANCSDPGPEGPAVCKQQGTYTPWTGALSARTPLVMLNRGAHFEPDAPYLRGWRAALHVVRERAPNAIVVARTTPPGIPHCISRNYSRPLRSPLPPLVVEDGYAYIHFPRQNRLLKQLVTEEFPGVLILDVEPLAALRPDARRGGEHGGDCLHFGSRLGPRRFLEVAADAPTALLVNALTMLHNDAMVAFE